MAIENEDPKVWANYPWQKTVIMLLSAVVFLFGLLWKKSLDDNGRERERVDNLRAVNKDQNDEIKVLRSELYNCKDESARYFRTQDSTNRAVLDQPARELLKQLNR